MFKVKYGITGVGTREPLKAVSLLKRYGYDGLEWGLSIREYLSNRNIATNLREEASEVRSIFQKEGLEVISLTPGLLLTDIKYSGLYELAYELAERLGTDKFRLFPAPYVRYHNPPSEDHAKYNGKRTYQDLYKETVDCLGRITEVGRNSVIKVVLETHDGYIASSLSLMYTIVSKFPFSDVAVLFDPENMIMIRESKEACRMSFELLGDYLSYFHLKDGGWVKEKDEGKYVKFPLGEGLVNYTKLFAALKKTGFSGCLCIEDMRDVSLVEKLSSIDRLKEIVEKAEEEKIAT